ncbi:MAG TPA: hypothetical protein VEJ20_02810, partial [Candidatus Eremiobacteraceae bacterium]|nr:hypothetical protein [Candidatus Eremiobacteraceae bacterium]
LGLSYNLGQHDALRADFGRAAQFPIDSQMDPGEAPADFEQQLAGVPAFFSPIWYCLYSQTGFDGEGLDPNCANSGAFNAAYGPYQDAGFYNYFNPFPCKTPVSNGVCSSDSNWPYPPPGQPNPAGPPVCGFGIFPFQNVPCTNYQQQLRWEMMNDGHFSTSGGFLNPIQPATFLNYSAGYMHEFADGIGHGWLQQQTQGIGASVTVWERIGQNLSTNTTEPVYINGNIERNSGNTPIFYPGILSAQGVDRANGIEARFTRARPYGLSLQFSGTYQHALTNCPSNGENGLYGCSISGASVLLNDLYYPAYITPLQTTSTISYHWRNGWTARTQIMWYDGFPIGPGTLFPTFVDGYPVVLPNTNAANPGNGSQQYIDPYDPGSLYSPNIAATAGTVDGKYQNQVWAPPFSFTNIQIEKQISPTLAVGLNLVNLFNEPYFGPSSNGTYQPVASGIGGPLSGLTQTTYTPGNFNYGEAGYVNEPYINLPQGEGRIYSIYATFKGI